MSNKKASTTSGLLGEVFADARSTYQALADALPISLLVKDADGKRLFANRTYLDLRGVTLDEILGKDDFALFPVEIAARYTADDQVVMRSGESLHDVEETLIEGNHRFIERIKCPIFDAKKNVIGVQLLFWDVTERRQAEDALQHEKRLLTMLLDNIPDSIYFKDAESHFMRISRAMAQKFGMTSADNAIGKTDADIFTTEHAVSARADELKIMQTGKPLVERIEKETWPDREDTWCMSTKLPLKDESGDIIGTFGISRDITELIRSQKELRKARDVANQANEAKSNFLANMSHEIRTPMNAIIGMSELLAQTDLTKEQRDYNNLVCESADSLLRLLNEILDFSKIEAHKLELEKIPFSIRDVVEKTGQTLAIRAAEKDLELLCRVAPEVPPCLLGDPGRLRQIMMNLIGNAIKFTPSGHVLVDITIDGAPPPNATEPIALRFQVVDTGIGIPQEKIDTILDVFTQADSSTTREFGGTGLGLAISRELIHLMEGDLNVKSTVGEGTTFWFVAPFQPASEQPQPDRHLPALSGTRVLVVDDNAVNRRILEEIFLAWGFEPTLVESGNAALSKLKEVEELSQPFNLAILDCMMPEMDGFQLTKAIRHQFPKTNTKLIMLSSANRADDSERCSRLGIVRYLTKPIVQSELLDSIINVLNEAEHALGPKKVTAKAGPIPKCRPLRVLVAEDGLANQQVALGFLRTLGHQSSLAVNGTEAVNQWKEALSGDRFDAILMDMHMPEMDGLEATQCIREYEKYKQLSAVPIVALTAAAMKSDADACRDSGMSGYLTKPIHPERLSEMLALATSGECDDDLFLDESDLQLTTKSQVLEESEDDPDGADLNDDSVDLATAETRIPGGAKGVKRLAKVFIEECQTILKTLDEAIPDKDFVLIQRSAHTLKSSSHLFGAERLSDTATKLEAQAKAESTEQLVELHKRISVEGQKTLSALRKYVGAT